MAALQSMMLLNTTTTIDADVCTADDCDAVDAGNTTRDGTVNGATH